MGGFEALFFISFGLQAAERLCSCNVIIRTGYHFLQVMFWYALAGFESESLNDRLFFPQMLGVFYSFNWEL